MIPCLPELIHIRVLAPLKVEEIISACIELGIVMFLPVILFSFASCSACCFSLVFPSLLSFFYLFLDFFAFSRSWNINVLAYWMCQNSEHIWLILSWKKSLLQILRLLRIKAVFSALLALLLCWIRMYASVLAEWFPIDLKLYPVLFSIISRSKKGRVWRFLFSIQKCIFGSMSLRSSVFSPKFVSFGTK